MERFCILQACLLAMLAWPATAWAQRDLVQDAVVWASSIKSNLLMVDDRWVGTASLHDGNGETAFYPEPDKAFEIHVRFGSFDTDCIPLDSVRVISTGLPIAPLDLEFGGTSAAFSSLNATIVDGAVTLDISSLSLCGKLLRLRFAPLPKEVGVVSLSAFSSGQATSAPPTFTVEPWKRGVLLRVQPEHLSGVVEFQRSSGGSTFVFTAEWDATVTWDKPGTGGVTYRGRRLGHDGTFSAWSDPVSMDVPAGSDRSDIIRGVVEGFYGRPWTWPQRLASMRLLAAVGLDTFVYAPKDDPYHRKDWRLPYPPAEMEQFGRLLEAAKACGVTASYAISPGLDMDPDSDEDFAALTAKLTPLLEMGYRSFVLAMDDITAPTNGTTGAKHAALTQKLGEWLAQSDAQLMFVPTVYFGTAGSRNQQRLDYLTALKAIPPSVPVMYTGEGVFDAVMDPEHVHGIGKLIGRKPLIWDNFPVNDFYFASSRLFMGPVTGRTAETMAETSGVLANPMTQQVASRASLLSYGNMLSDSGAYQPVHLPAELAAVFQLAESSAHLDLFVADHSRSPKMNPGLPEIPALTIPASAFLNSLTGDTAEKLDSGKKLLQALAARYLSDASLFDLNTIPSLADEMWAPVAKRQAELEVAFSAVSLLASQEKVAGASDRFSKVRLSHSPYPIGWAWFAFTEALGPLFNAASDAAKQDLNGTVTPETFVPKLPDEAVQGETVTAELPDLEGYTYQIYSQSGATIQGTTLSWTPATPGNKRHVLEIQGPGILWAVPWTLYVHETKSETTTVVADPDGTDVGSSISESPKPDHGPWCSGGCTVSSNHARWGATALFTLLIGVLLASPRRPGSVGATCYQPRAPSPGSSLFRTRSGP